MKLKIKIAIPGRVVWESEANEINIQTTTGKIGILPNHAPLLTAIETGVLTIKDENQNNYMVLSDGYLSLNKNSLFIATDRCILENSIDSTKIEQDYKIAVKNFNNAKTPGKKYIANKALKRVNACFEVLNINK